MSLETDLQSTLQAVASRVFPDFAPNETPEPYVVWRQLGGTAVTPVGKEVPNRRSAVFAISAWAKTRAEANTLILAIDSAMRTAQVFDAKPQGEFMAVIDEETDTRGAIQMFAVHGYR